MYKKILIAVDVSNEAQQVFKAGREIASRDDAEVSVIHVAELPRMDFGQWPGYEYAPMEEQVKKSSLARLEKMSADYGISKDVISVEFGRATKCILDRADAMGADLIIMGSHGRHGIQRLLGSTANGVLHNAKCDVLAVRIKAEE